MERVPILVVDDRRANLVALEAALEGHTYEIILAHSGAEALGKLLARQFAVILLDVAMPELDGYETARMIRARDRTRHIPIVFVTAHMSEAAQIFQGYEHGAVDYLVKPLDIHALKMKVSVFAELFRYGRRLEEASRALAAAEHRARLLSEALYDVTFEEAPIGIGHVSDEIRWLRVNARMASILARTREELRDRSMLEYVHDDDRERLAVDMKGVLAGKTQRHQAEYRMVDRDGHAVWIHLSVSLIRDPDGKAVQLTIIDNMSEEKRLARELEKSQRSFAKLRDSGLLGIYEQDATSVVTDANDAFLAMIGYTRDEVRGRSLRLEQLVGQPTSETSLAAGVTPTHESAFIRKDGTTGVMLVGAVADGTTVGFTLDVTSLRDAEQFRATSTLEIQRSLRARDDFVSVLAHELRNPLTPLLMQLATLRAAAAAAKEPLDPARVDKQLAVVQRATSRLARLSEELLTVSRSAVGGVTLEPEELDLVALVREVVVSSQRELDRARCELSLHADATAFGFWDRLALERVVTQLLSNAMKYGAGRPIEVSVRADDGGAVLSVRDHGIGITPEQRAQLFERFSRQSPLQNYGGFGVGLWLVRLVVEAHGGRVTTRDPEGGGAEFTVRISSRVPSSEREEARASVAPTPARVLVVDDDEDIREIFAIGLTSLGYTVRTAANGREALEAIAREVPDLVLLDMMMPVMSGAEFLATLRSDDRYREVPAIVVSAWPGEGATRAAQAVLAKPVDLGELVRTIERVVHKVRGTSAGS